MTERNERRLFGRQRRANVEGGREKSYRVYVTADEDAQLRARAVVADVTVPRFLFESAMNANIETTTDRKKAIAEMFTLTRLMANVSNNVNQLAATRTLRASFRRKRTPSLTNTVHWPSRSSAPSTGWPSHDAEHQPWRPDGRAYGLPRGEGARTSTRNSTWSRAIRRSWHSMDTARSTATPLSRSRRAWMRRDALSASRSHGRLGLPTR